MTKKKVRAPKELDDATVELIRQLEEAKAARQAWEEIAEKLRQEVINALGDADEGRADGRKVVIYSRSESTWIDAASLKTFYPEVWDLVAHRKASYRLTTTLTGQQAKR